MLHEYTARQVALDVLNHLERRRPTLVGDPEAVEREVQAALEPMRRGYAELELPPAYFEALAGELHGALPARWRAVATTFTALEARGFGVWRGGDPLARIVFVLAGLLLGIVLVRLPFIPIWERWIPFVLAVLAYWLPEVQIRSARRGYLRQLAEIADELGSAQPALDRHLTLELDPPAPPGTKQ